VEKTVLGNYYNVTRRHASVMVKHQICNAVLSVQLAAIKCSANALGKFRALRVFCG